MDIFADTPELMTVQEYHSERIKRRGLPDTADTQIESMRLLGQDLWNAARAGLPLNADAVLTLRNSVGPIPECVGYVKKNNRYVRHNGIKCSALRIDGKVYEGARHSDIIRDAVRSGVKLNPYPSGDDFGFITDTGMFVNRERALKIALASGQVKEGMTLSRHELHSEDIL